MYSAKCDRAEATGNVDAKLNNAMDWGESVTLRVARAVREAGVNEILSKQSSLPTILAHTTAYQKMAEKASLGPLFH